MILKKTIFPIILSISILFLISSISIIYHNNKMISDFSAQIKQENTIQAEDFYEFDHVFNLYKFNSDLGIDFKQIDLIDWFHISEGLCNDNNNEDYHFCDSIEFLFDEKQYEKFTNGENIENIEDYTVYFNENDFSVKIYHNDRLVYYLSKINDNDKQNNNTLNNIVGLDRDSINTRLMFYENQTINATNIKNKLSSYSIVNSEATNNILRFLISGESLKKNPDLTSFLIKENFYERSLLFWNGYIAYKEINSNIILNEALNDLNVNNYNLSIMEKFFISLIRFYRKIGLIGA